MTALSYPQKTRVVGLHVRDPVLPCRFINDLVARYNRPVWLTEFACPNEGGTLDRQITYMRSALKVLDDTEAVERYAA